MKNGRINAIDIRKVCVFCGSRRGHNPNFSNAAIMLGQKMAHLDMELIYGGGGVGLMGDIAQAVIDAGGRVTGIIPDFLQEKEEVLIDVDELIITKSMHERKQIMYEISDAFVTLPGGIGTVDELVEMMTLSKLHQHAKPIILVNLEGYWDPFLQLMKHMQAEDYIDGHYTPSYTVVDSIDATIQLLATNQPQIHKDVEAIISNRL